MKTPIGIIKDWHQPNNADCPHNHDIDQDCACRRPVNRKPFRVCRVHDSLTTDRSYRTRPDIVLEVWPNGRLIFREKGKRSRFETTAVKVYEGLRWKAGMLAAQKAKAAKAKNRRKH